MVTRVNWSKSTWILLFAVLNILNILFFTSDFLFLKHVSRINVSHVQPQGYLINTPGCKIQDFDPFTFSFSSYLHPPNIINCNKRPPLVKKINLYTLTIDFDILKEYYKDLDYCVYTPIFRSEEGRTDNKYKYGEDVIFYNNITAKHEFVKIECFYDDIKIYQDFYPFIIKNITSTRSYFTSGSKPLSVMILGIDSVSRLNFIRYCPQSYHFLQSQMKAIELKGYNKVGDNTFVNLVPMLSGKFVSELPWNSSQSFDHIPIIWKEFSKYGYHTLFAEDSPSISLFNFEMLGFFNQPTDHYLRPFYLALEESELTPESEYVCAGHRYHSSLILEWLYDFSRVFHDELSFSFTFLTSLTHDVLENLASLDKVLKAFLKTLLDEDLLSNTMLILMSDHGMRFGNFRNTYLGRLEERLPMAFVIFPLHFHNTHNHLIEVVKKNSNKLTTPFDIYATLQDIFHWNKINHDIVVEATRSISLFRNIPENRTCESANILPHWCTCQTKNRMDISDSLVINISYFIIDTINNFTLNHRHLCKQLTLDLIKEAWFSSANSDLLKYIKIKGDGIVEDVMFGNETNSIKDVTVMLTAKPSSAGFEATVRIDEKNQEMKLMGEISRTDRYSDQSQCIRVKDQKKFCFCSKK